MMTVGFVGLGHMGLPMAINCLKAGNTVIGYDLAQPAMETLVQAGGKGASDLATLAKQSDVIITMLQTGDQVKSVCLGEKGLFAHAQKESYHIDCSTIDVGTARHIHQQAKIAGLHSLDAPVSGGVAGARAGQLTFMVGGDINVLNALTPLLNCMAKKVIHAGSEGNGQAAKICNNMILGISMLAVSESFVLAEKLGLPKQKLHEIVSNASGQCWTMEHYVPVGGVLENVPANVDYQPGFSAAMMLKDLNLSQTCANEYHQTLPMGKLAQTLYQQMQNEGKDHLDFSAIIQLIAAMKD
ncbi:3-hydroxyisobutyrate dehydrogenase [Legionella sp. W05-934-2]|uniref:3-hydroxyisobutyrate dehydrogenase n=1 Tax=Legionella sp. W05-934-2 TaxID=1198649 RepID=UPI0034631814